MNHCFGSKVADGAAFWMLWASMSGNDGERMNITMGYTKEHIAFMVQLEEYLKHKYPEGGFGGYMQKDMNHLTSYVAKSIDEGSNAITNEAYFINPIFN